MEAIYYAVKVAALLWILMIVFIVMLGGNKSEKEDRSSKLFIMITISIVLPAIGYTVDAGTTAPGAFSWGYPFISYLGFFVTFSGIFIHIMGISTLSKQWSPVVVFAKDHKLIETGIYQYIRHPIYTGILLEILGFGLALANWLSILILVLLNGASLAYRIHVEEKALERYFGDAYLKYAQRTKRLIPWVF